jgi:hypothetical protein
VSLLGNWFDDCQAKPSQAKPSQAKPSFAQQTLEPASIKKARLLKNWRAFLWAINPGLIKQG